MPATLEELRDIATFFQGREIDGTTVYGAAIYTERGSEGITMGVTNALYNYGFMYEDPAAPYQLDGFVNSAGAVAGWNSTSRFTIAASRRGLRTGIWARISMPTGPVRWPCR